MSEPTNKGQRLKGLIDSRECPRNVRDMLNEAAYTMSECGQWPDNVDNVSPEQVVLCWQLVEWLRERELFPTDLRM
jgi:hypothetical protein